MKQASFDASFGDGDTNLDDLIEDILDHDIDRGEGIKDSKQFLIDCGISEKLAEKTLKDY